MEKEEEETDGGGGGMDEVNKLAINKLLGRSPCLIRNCSKSTYTCTNTNINNNNSDVRTQSDMLIVVVCVVLTSLHASAILLTKQLLQDMRAKIL